MNANTRGTLRNARFETKLLRLPVLLILLAAFASASVAQTPPALNTKSKDSLRGLVELQLVVDISSREERLGVTAALLYADLEPRLRKAGIRVVNKQEAELLPGKPTLYAKLMIFQLSADLYTSLSDVQLRQEVSLRRQPITIEMAATWQNSAIGIMGGMPPDTSIKKMCDGLGSVVDWFIRDYQSVNSK